mmetsp:Transcript_5816/g.17184  ORF Transcript_5816/g.17184 Transcript_5816/m.17184 type:complete len:169 (+) Transcript_5816:141-647(+)
MYFGDSEDESEAEEAAPAPAPAPEEEPEEAAPAADAKDDAPAAPKLPSALDALKGGAPQYVLRPPTPEPDPPAMENRPAQRQTFNNGVEEAREEEARHKALHEKLKKEGRANKRKRDIERREEHMAKPAYERQSMHGQKIAISVGPSSLPDNMRTTYSSIPSKNTKWK